MLLFRKYSLLIVILLISILSFAGDFKPPVVAILPFDDFSEDSDINELIAFGQDYLFQLLYDSEKVRLIEMKRIGEIIEGDYIENGKLKRKEYLETVKNLGAEMVFFVEVLSADRNLVKGDKIITEVTTSGRMVRLFNGEVVCMETIKAKKKVSVGTTNNIYEPVFRKSLKKLSKKVTRKIKKYFK